MFPYKNAYIYLHEEQIYTFLYIKLTKERLANALLTYVENEEKPYLSVFFDPDGRDFLGRLSSEEINQLIEECSMKNILTTTYDEMIKSFPNLSREIYNNCRDLCKSQLDKY